MKKKWLQYNLQTFADGGGEPNPDDKGGNNPEPNSDDKGGETNPKPDDKSGNTDNKPEPNTQELMTELAKLKRAFDKTSSELAATKKALKEKMTEQEIASQEKAEAEAAEAERVAGLERENKIFKATTTYLGMAYTQDEAERMAVAEVDGDFETRTKIMKEVEARKMKELESKFLANRPDVNAGNGSGVLTKEKFDQMSMVEKSQLRKSDPDAYERFIGRKAI